MVVSRATLVLFLVASLLWSHHFKTNEARSFPDATTLFSEAPDYRNWANCPAKNDASFSCDPSAIHVAMTIDSKYLRGSIASVHSILTHATCPENLFFHFVASDGDSSSDSETLTLTLTLETAFPSLSFKLHVFREATVAGLISPSIREALDTPLNYARAYLAEMLDRCVERVIYLDSDTIVVDDIGELWRVSIPEPKAVAAPEYCLADFGRYFTAEFWSDGELVRRAFDGGEKKKKKRPCYFNTGVMVMDLRRWRERGLTAEIEAWMRVQREEKRIYELGSLPPFLLVFAGEVEAIDHRWNQHGLGGDNVVNTCRGLHEGPVSLLHWSGKGKPWARLDSGEPCPVDFLWAPYDLYRQRLQ